MIALIGEKLQNIYYRVAKKEEREVRELFRIGGRGYWPLAIYFQRL
jgi:hypothetical protein